MAQHSVGERMNECPKGLTIEIPTINDRHDDDNMSLMSDLYFPEESLGDKDENVAAHSLGSSSVARVLTKGFWSNDNKVSLLGERTTTTAADAAPSMARAPLRSIHPPQTIGIIHRHQHGRSLASHHKNSKTPVVGPSKIALLGKGTWGQRVTVA
mmetsp:Transcript_4098/g.8455  ORF Transcript_4098/g.8455 Transcript_4098/m.8455 type:complete len:155 (-) Transcript_4098:230-694(-)